MGEVKTRQYTLDELGIDLNMVYFQNPNVIRPPECNGNRDNTVWFRSQVKEYCESKDLRIRELEAMLEKAVEQRNGLCEGYSPHSGVEIRHYDAELQAAAEAVRGK